MTLLEVAVSAPVRQTFTYGLSGRQSPVEDAAAGYIGRRVLVPFGARQATVPVVRVEGNGNADLAHIGALQGEFRVVLRLRQSGKQQRRENTDDRNHDQ